MGIIKRQSISGTIYAYIGVVIGFITTGLLFPEALSTTEVGLLKLLVSISVLFAQFSGLGFNAVMVRNFPFFRDKEKNHHGFLTLSLAVNTAGFVIVMTAFLLLRPWLIEENIEKSALFVEYIYYLIPLIFFTSYFNLLDTYYRIIYNSTKGIVIKELWQRIFILASVFTYYLGYIDFQLLVITYSISVCLPALMISWSLWRQGEFNLKWEKGFISKSMSKEMFNVSLYGIATSFSGVLILNVDIVMINHFLALSATGIYSIAFYFGTLVLIPSRPVIKIASVLIADGWKEKDLKKIDEIYQKSNMVLTILAFLMFIGLWVNIDNVFHIIGDEYITGKYVILFIGLANVFEMSTSVSQYIINNSAYYRVITWYLLLFVAVLIITNLIFIPIYGIVGCAVASAFSRLIYNFLSWFFLYRKFKFQPFNFRYFYLIGITIVSFIVPYLIPEMSHFLIDMVVRSSVLVIIFSVSVYFSRISPDLNETFQNILKQLKLIK